VRFNSYDRTIKRWYPKVVQAAEERINQLVADAGISLRGEYCAEFDTSCSGPPRLIKRSNNTCDFRVITFCTKDWSSVDAAIPSAVRQLSSVLAMNNRNPRLRLVFESAGIDLEQAELVTERVPDDQLQHATLHLRHELTTDRFAWIVDRVETELNLSGSGEVSGTGCGIGGWTIDLSGPAIDQSIAVAIDELEQLGLDVSITH
jgi:hypothetical protein